ncbi:MULTISPECIES: helix-turn-helix domain-containing protein [Amniculibacterium]|jgi:transcriptional regulator with XRE-family HTH domain|uniref:helix-turn-helix domain-containing protein n=1 Tax=Amniculibacterium TaxID=2715289 RepID=UPI000F59A479|nr:MULTISPECIES: helix-turn-helix transcriptional regulator [Amniculibacterium]
MKIKTEMLREARRKKDYSQEYIAHLLDISQSHYSKIENGDTHMDIIKLGKLFDILDLNPLESIEFSDKQQIFINSAMSGNYYNNNCFNTFDEVSIRKIITEELSKMNP